jgi:hypothetical protein
LRRDRRQLIKEKVFETLRRVGLPEYFFERAIFDRFVLRENFPRRLLKIRHAFFLPLFIVGADDFGRRVELAPGAVFDDKLLNPVEDRFHLAGGEVDGADERQFLFEGSAQMNERLRRRRE